MVKNSIGQHMGSACVLAIVVSVSSASAETSKSHNCEVCQMANAKGYLVNLDPKSCRQLLAISETIELGTTVEKIQAVLGLPTEDVRLVGKKGEFRARLTQYYIRKRSHLVNEKIDRYVSFYFDEHDALFKISYKFSEKPERKMR
jgi:hypothetical protein